MKLLIKQELDKKILAVLCFVFLAFQAWLSFYIARQESVWVEPLPAVQKWDPLLYRVLSFGHLPVAVDLLTLRVLVDTTLTTPAQGEHHPFYYDMDMILDLDPLNFDVTLIGAYLLTVAQKDGWGAKKILTKSNQFRKTDLAQYPEKTQKEFWGEKWRIPMLLAYTCLFQLDDMPGASLAFQEASAIPGVPEFVKRLDQRLKKSGGEYEVGLKLLKFMMTTPQGEIMKEELERKHHHLEVSQYVYQMNQDKNKQNLKADPWGGKIYLDTSSQIGKRWKTTTPYEPVFGLH